MGGERERERERVVVLVVVSKMKRSVSLSVCPKGIILIKATVPLTPDYLVNIKGI